jgi:hypothetical protein
MPMLALLKLPLVILTALFLFLIAALAFGALYLAESPARLTNPQARV